MMLGERGAGLFMGPVLGRSLGSWNTQNCQSRMLRNCPENLAQLALCGQRPQQQHGRENLAAERAELGHTIAPGPPLDPPRLFQDGRGSAARTATDDAAGGAQMLIPQRPRLFTAAAIRELAKHP